MQIIIQENCKKDIKIRAKKVTIDAIKQKYTNFTDNNFEEI